MIKLNIFNMERFLLTVNECKGAINIIQSNGHKEDIRNRDDLQFELMAQYQQNHGSLVLKLDIPNAKDYMKVVFYYIGDC